MAEVKFDESILVNILARIPADSVVTSKATCKTWEAVIKDPYFVRAHTQRLLNNYYHFTAETQDDSAKATGPQPPLGFIFLVGGRHATDRDRELYIGDYCYGSKHILQKQLNCAPIGSCVSFVGSCNGLVCLAVQLQHGALHDPIYVFNPITREYLNLPRFSKQRDLEGRMAFGFGYHAPTQKYKVVRIYYGAVRQLQVYTLGNPEGKWRNLGKISYSVDGTHGKFCNGALHWFAEGGIVSFDLGDEGFRMLPPVPITFDADSRFSIFYRLGELNGCLYAAHRKYNGNVDSTELWILRRKKKNQREDVDEYFWIKEYRIECEFDPSKFLIPVSISENSSKLLLWSYGRNDGTKLVEHNQKYPNVLKLLNDDYKHLVLGIDFAAVPYIKSLVSLKALGENAKLMEAKGSVEFMNVEGDAT